MDFQPGGGCTASPCQASSGWQCSYVDPADRRCQTLWCPSHAVFLGQAPFCRRHATILQAVAVNLGTIREVPARPRLDDRGMGLALMVGNDLDARIIGMLRQKYETQPGVVIDGDHVPRAVWRDGVGVRGAARELTWEWKWSVSQSSGFLRRIVLSVPAASPPVVIVKVDQRTVFEGVPEWIWPRSQSEQARTLQHSRFVAMLVGAIRSSAMPRLASFGEG